MGLIKMISNAIKSNQIPPETHFRNDVEKDMYINNTLGYRGVKDRVDYHDALYKRIGELYSKYKDGSDNTSYISDLENLIKEHPDAEKSVWSELVTLYTKEGKNDIAWGYLNKLSTNKDIELEKVRHEQTRILKKEKRYIPALDMILSEYLIKASKGLSINTKALIKDIGVCTHALKWDDKFMYESANILLAFVEAKNFDEVSLHSQYKKYLEGKGLLKEV